MPSHQEIDQRSLALHKLVADKVRADGRLLGQARDTLTRWYGVASPRSFTYLDEWQRLFDLGTEACLTAATEDTERAAALRQCSPLSCLLTNQERFAFLKRWKCEHAAQ
ncbi:MAG: hypothetical protein RLZ68_100 [Pseudomonadota bacterium]|jgi:hypothetical protein